MTLHNPWGLLALLSIPAIVFLHFFRETRRMRHIGGLHLWDFAKSRRPSGRQWDRLNKTLSLLCEILTALFLTLILSGLDLPAKDEFTHYILILDDSASMQGAGSKARAKQIAESMGGANDRHTMIAAGVSPRILEGPFARRGDFLKALKAWEPESAVCRLDEALDLASKFSSLSDRIIFVTDRPDQAKDMEERLIVQGVGRPAANRAIIYADRALLPDMRHKVSVFIRSHGGATGKFILRGTIEGHEVFNRELDTEGANPIQVFLEMDANEHVLALDLEEDAMETDNHAMLAPPPAKTVRAHIGTPDELARPIFRAARATGSVSFTDTPADANLVFTTQSGYIPSGNTVRVYVFPAQAMFRDDLLQIAEGRDVYIEERGILTENLSLEGVLWPYIGRNARTEEVFLSSRRMPLYYQTGAAGDIATRHVNLIWDRTNLFRHAAWPIMVHAMIEECRRAMPGLARNNYAAGEDIHTGRAAQGSMAPWALLRNGKAHASFEAKPGLLTDLPPGVYELRDRDGRDVSRFCVNLFSEAESNLDEGRSIEGNPADRGSAARSELHRSTPLYMGLVLLMILCAGLAWKFQEQSR